MKSLPATLEIDKIEKFFSLLSESPESQVLQIPVGSSKFAFGGYAAAIQAVNTWANLSKDRKVEIKPSQKTKDEVVVDIIAQPHKFTAMMMAKQIDLPSEETPNVRPDINHQAKCAIERQSENNFGQNRGRLCWYSFVDHSTKGFVPQFYSTMPGYHPSPKSVDKITSLVRSMVERSASVAGGATLPDDSKVNNLGRMFYELFVNTHEHGTKSENRSVWLKPATRVIYSYGINLVEEAISKSISNDEVLSQYIDNLNQTQNSTRRFVEISIVDSGLGFCGRWLADHNGTGSIKEMDVSEQYAILKQCFKFRSSSTPDEIKGNGLPAVMANLTALNGFMKVRSNNLSVYRDFVSNPFLSNQNDDYNFFDWRSKKCCSEKVTEQADTRGVAVTVLIPLFDKGVEQEVTL